GVHDADDGSEQADEWPGRSDCRQTTDAAFQLRMDNCLRTFESAARGIDFFARNLVTELVRFKLLQARDNNLGQVALVVTVRDFDGFVEFTFTQRACDGRSELT